MSALSDSESISRKQKQREEAEHCQKAVSSSLREHTASESLGEHGWSASSRRLQFCHHPRGMERQLRSWGSQPRVAIGRALVEEASSANQSGNPQWRLSSALGESLCDNYIGHTASLLQQARSIWFSQHMHASNAKVIAEISTDKR